MAARGTRSERALADSSGGGKKRSSRDSSLGSKAASGEGATSGSSRSRHKRARGTSAGDGSTRGAGASTSQPVAASDAPTRVVVTKGVASYLKRCELWQRAADGQAALRGALLIRPVSLNS